MALCRMSKRSATSFRSRSRNGRIVEELVDDSGGFRTRINAVRKMVRETDAQMAKLTAFTSSPDTES